LSAPSPPVLREISVVIPTLGRPVLARALRSLAEGSALPARVVVVHQGQDPAVERIVRSAETGGLETEYVPSGQRGRSAGVNRGIERVVTRFVAVTDDDCLVEPGWLEALYRRLAAEPGAIVTGRVEAGGDEPVAVVATSRERWVQRRPRLTFDSLSGGNMAASVQLLRRLGMLDEDPRLATAEDAELAYRALRRGVPLVFEPEAGVMHLGWRNEGERARQYAAYARSHGGFYGKYLRRGDLLIAARALLHAGRAARRWLAGRLAGNADLAENGRAYTLGLPGGIMAGLRRTPRGLDPSTLSATLGEAPGSPGTGPAAPDGTGRPDREEDPRPLDPDVAVLILTMDQKARTLSALESLEPELGPGVRVLVWDNGSTDGTPEAVADRFPGVAVHAHHENLGVAGGRNAAARKAVERWDPELLLFLDNDMILEPGFVEALRAAFRRDPALAQAQGKLRFMDEPELLNDGGGFRVRFWLGRTEPVGFREVDRGQRDRARPCIPCGGAMMVRSRVFRELGGFDETFNPFGPEDLDFSLRVKEKGYPALYVPAATAYHAVSHTFESGSYSELYARHKSRHWLVLLRRHAPFHQQAGFFLAGAPWGAFRMLLREGWRGGPAALRGWVRGVLDLSRTP
jgi:GT2 family glycosyltransferase